MKRFILCAFMCGLTLAMVSGADANQLLNGNFEGSAVSCWGAPPVEWSGYNVYPKVFDGSCPFSDLNAAPDGPKFAGESWSYGSRKAGGIYQQIICNASSTGTFRTMWAVYNNQSWEIVIRVGIDPAGGTDPAATSVVWSQSLSWDETENGNFPAAAGWGSPSDPASWIETPEITSVGKKVTCFIDYYTWPGPGGLVGFDKAEVTGTLTEFAEETFPPNVRNLALTGNPVMGDVVWDYQLFEPNGVSADYSDPDASLFGFNNAMNGNYRIGGIFDSEEMPYGFDFDVLPATYTHAATTTQGPNPTPGVGTLYVRGLGYRTAWPTVDHFYWHDFEVAPGVWDYIRNAPNLVAQPFGIANQAISVVAKFTNWKDSADEFTPIVQDWEGAAVYMSTPDKRYFYSVGGFQDPGPFNTATWIGAYWSTLGGPNGWNQDYYINIQPNPVGNGVSNPPMWLGLRRVQDAFGDRIFASYSRTSGEAVDMQDIHMMTLGGTGLEFNKSLVFGVYINEGLVICLDWIQSGWLPSSNGAGGDGVMDLACTPDGVNHSYAWNAADLLPFYNRNAMNAPSVQFALRARDLDGPGAYALSDWDQYAVAPVAPSYVEDWQIFE